jgi:HlyD family secretion protein
MAEKKKSKRFVKPVVFTLLGLIVLAGAGYAYLTFTHKAQAAATVQESSFKTATVRTGSLIISATGSGTLKAGKTVNLSFSTSGVVGMLNVKVGDTVEKGQVLAELQDLTSLKHNVTAAELDLTLAQQSVEDLKANAPVNIANAKVALINAQAAYDDAAYARKKLDYSRGSAETIASAQAQYYLAKQEVERAETIYGNFSERSEDDPQRALALTNLEAAKTRRDKALINLNWYLGHPSEADYTEADAKLSLAEAQLADAQREWDRLKDGPDPEDIAAAQARVDALSATLRLQQLPAPFNGTITQVNIKAGDQVNQTTQAFRLDDLSRLLVDLQLSEVDINRVKVGQQVSLTFDAIADQSYTGQVVQVARVGTAAQGAVNFGVTIELDNADESVLPGMTAAVNIVVEQLDNVLLVPNRAIRFRNNQRVVYLNVPGGAPRAVEIELGASSDTESQIISDQIKEGDEIVLNPPTELFTPGNGQMMGR